MKKIILILMLTFLLSPLFCDEWKTVTTSNESKYSDVVDIFVKEIAKSPFNYVQVVSIVFTESPNAQNYRWSVNKKLTAGSYEVYLHTSNGVFFYISYANTQGIAAYGYTIDGHKYYNADGFSADITTDTGKKDCKKKIRSAASEFITESILALNRYGKSYNTSQMQGIDAFWRFASNYLQ